MQPLEPDTIVAKQHKSRWLKVLVVTLGTIAVLALAAYGFYETQKTGHSDPQAREPVQPTEDAILLSIRRGVAYVKSYQEHDGEFSRGMLDPKPAFTALVVDALVRSPERYNEADHPWLALAVEAILRHRQENGSICTPLFQLDNYATAISVMALTHVDSQKYADTIARARNFLVNGQNESGGWGYGPDSRSDGSNTIMALSALHESGSVDAKTVAGVRRFLNATINDSEFNPAPWVNDGKGFIYGIGEGDRKGLGESKVYAKLPDGREVPLAYGLMSYAGLTSFIYAEVDRSDPRVKSAFEWVKNNYNLERNVNLKHDGLMYYYLTMAKALATYGRRLITTSDGAVHDWPVELSEKVISLQKQDGSKQDGSWVNERSGRWLESDAVMVTAFMIRTLSICHDGIHGERAQ